ncbi:GspH/FimT family protein [Thermus amyloliquefaciens]|uniref:GspH/FimT family protein n=1 Tax=Thermus amyloliquefaciens TaxID=1449080 RepID=UPI000572087B|nr:GspH/FimT family protein [Thermus amyloliquefaciens]
MRRKGLSLLELLVVLGVLGVLLGLGLPLLSPNRLALDAAARSLAAQVTRARLEAIRHNAFAGLQVFTEGAGGYAVFLDRNGNRAYDPGEEVQRVRFGEGDWARVRLDPGQSALGNMPLLFDPRGLPAKPITGTIALSSGPATRKVVVSQQGRARLE